MSDGQTVEINLPRDTTIKELVALQRTALITGSPNAADMYYKSLVDMANTKEAVDNLFAEWWR